MCIYFLNYLCYSQSFVRKSRKWHTALKEIWILFLMNKPIKKNNCLQLFEYKVPAALLFICFWFNCVKYKEVSLSLCMYTVYSTHSTVLLKIWLMHKDDCSTSYVLYCTTPVLNINSKHCGLLSIVVPDLWPRKQCTEEWVLFVFSVCVL